MQGPVSARILYPACYPWGMQTDFGTRLSTLRKTRGLTQAQLAQQAGLSIRALSYYENHAQGVSGNLALKLASELGVSIEELLGAATTKASAPVGAMSSGCKPNEDIHLWRRFQRLRSLPVKDQRAVFRLLNSLVGSRQDD